MRIPDRYAPVLFGVPMWLAAQRYFMGLVLGGFAVRLALEERR